MARGGDYFNNWGWANSSSNIITTNGTTIAPYYAHQYFEIAPGLSPVLESPSRELSDREWLDAQVEEVCAAA